MPGRKRREGEGSRITSTGTRWSAYRLTVGEQPDFLEAVGVEQFQLGFSQAGVGEDIARLKGQKASQERFGIIVRTLETGLSEIVAGAGGQFQFDFGGKVVHVDAYFMHGKVGIEIAKV